MGIGRINGEPMETEYEGLKATLLWVDIPRSWDPDSIDSVPILFVGKRMKLLAQAKVETYEGTLVYVLGELSSRIKLKNPKVINIGVCVFVTSITFWDTKSIEQRSKAKVSNQIILSDLESEEAL